MQESVWHVTVVNVIGVRWRNERREEKKERREEERDREKKEVQQKGVIWFHDKRQWLSKKVTFKSPLKHLDIGVEKRDVLSVVSGQPGSKMGIIRITVDEHLTKYCIWLTYVYPSKYSLGHEIRVGGNYKALHKTACTEHLWSLL